MDDTALLAFLGVKPDALPLAPDSPSREEKLARLEPAPVGCVVCGGPAWLTRTISTDAGCCWLDLCRPHRLAVSEERRRHVPDVPVPISETLAVLLWAAEEIGLRMRIIASGGGD